MMNWRRWAKNPPQLPHAPIEILGPAGPTITSVKTIGTVNPPGPWLQSIIWRPTGLYREEFFAVTREWE